MDKNKKIELLADLFEVEPDEIVENQELEAFEPWDSMSKLSLIVLNSPANKYAYLRQSEIS